MNILVVLALTALAGNVSEERVLKESSKGENWFLKGGDFTGQHYSPWNAVNTETVGELGLAWSAELPIPDGVSTLTPAHQPSRY